MPNIINLLIQARLNENSKTTIETQLKELQAILKPLEIKVDKDIINTLNYFIKNLDKVSEITKKSNQLLSEEVKITQELNGITTKAIKQQMSDGSIITRNIETTNKAKQQSINLAQKEVEVQKAIGDQIMKISTLNAKSGTSMAVTSGTKTNNSTVLYGTDGAVASEKIIENITAKQADNYKIIKTELANIATYRKNLLGLSEQDTIATDHWKMRLQESGAIIKQIYTSQINVSEGEKQTALGDTQQLQMKRDILKVQKQIADTVIKQQIGINNTPITTASTYKGSILTTSPNLVGSLTSEKTIAQELSKVYQGLEIREVSLDKATSKWTATIAENATQNRKIKGELDAVNGSLYKHSDAMVQAKNKDLGFFQQFKIAMERVPIWFAAMTIIYGGLQKIREGVTFLNDLNKSMTNISMITGQSHENIVRMTQDYVNLAATLHDTIANVQQASEEFLRAGNNQEETMALIKASTVMSKIAGQDQKETADQLIAITNGFGIAAEDTMSVVDKLTAVDNASATSTKELGIAIERTSASAQMAGVTFDQIVSWIATISSVTRKSASSIGESLWDFAA